jgi:hypothetical protein
MLKKNGYNSDVKKISESEIVKNIIEQSNILQEERRVINRGKEFYISPYFCYDFVMARLDSYLNIPTEYSNGVMCDLLIAFCARPHELENLSLTPEGFISGFGKSRDNIPKKFVGLRNLNESIILLKIVTKIYDSEKFRKFVKNNFKMLPSQFRKIGAEYVSMNEENIGKKRMIKKDALRHSNISTSIMYYDIPSFS